MCCVDHTGNTKILPTTFFHNLCTSTLLENAHNILVTIFKLFETIFYADEITTLDRLKLADEEIAICHPLQVQS